MNDEELAGYINGRYVGALKYYDGRAVRNQRYYHVCSTYVLCVSIAVTPILMGDWPKGSGLLLAAILSPTLALVAGIADHFRFHENWLSSRATWDALQHELQWRNAKVGPYKGEPDANACFVERVEAVISREGAEWLSRHATKDRADSAVSPRV